MPTTPEPLYSASSPPFILDTDMSRRIDSDPDFEFFDPNAGDSPGIFADDFATDPQYLSTFASPANHKSPLPDQGSLLESKARHTLSAPSTASPGGSYQDSSSESSTGYKRKSSSDSSRSLTSGDVMMADDTDMGEWKVDDLMVGNDMSSFSAFDGTVDPSSMSNNYEFNDKSMEKDFDFDSAASSPSPFIASGLQMNSPEMPTIKYDTPKKVAPLPKTNANKHVKMNSQHSVTQSMNGLTTAGSREVSPLSAMVTSQESSPSAFFNNSPSPGNGIEFINGQMLGNHHTPNWMGNGRTFSSGLSSIPKQSINAQSTPRLAAPYQHQNMGVQKFQLSVHPIPLKSRVETQIPIKLTLFPMPPGIAKLHLPTHTISKPKLLAKPTPERSPDMLELYTTLVCTSAMQNQDNLRRAFERAAIQKEPFIKDESSDESGSDESDEKKPLNGGDVNICVGCITRERKRAARKKVKKVEEEESWHKDEAKRVVVFNTHEVKDWQAPTAQPASDAVVDRPEPFVRDGSLQVDAPMRIACYCRHQNEKLGFQVIFTIKDFQDKLIAQAITSSIMITDDHKTHNMPTLSTHNSNGSETQPYSGSGAFQTDTNFSIPAGPNGINPPFRLSQSTSDLQNLQQNYSMQFQSPVSQPPSTTTSTSMTPRNLSRQTSPLASSGPVSKKRKASSSGGKVPSGLAMTRLETGEPSTTQGPSMGSNNSAMPSPYTPNHPNFPLSIDHQFGQTAHQNHGMPMQLQTGPPTPNSNDQNLFSNANRSQSMDNLAMQSIYSTPGSAIPSRVSSPTGTRNAMQAYQQQQLVQAVNGMYSMPMAMNAQRPPTIHKMIPNEGPKAGGIEVTCLGSGFFQGLEVMFGDCRATTTTFWGETSLVCLLPPSAFAGTVAVTFKHQHQPQHMSPYPTPPVPKQPQTYFKYIDDDEQQIIRTALAVLGHKMTGKMEDVRDLARRIVGDGPSSWGATSPNGGPNQQVSGSGFSAATFGVDVEATLLRCLDLIDLDDSPNMPRLNLRRASGQTMLHLACSLGLHRFVAALLARGANPEPRDKGGFTPMHFAALHGHPQIVRRLMLSGADPSVRSLQGFTPSDMATSEEVLRATRRVEHHSRTRSGGSLRSRTSSATSLRSVWESASTPAAQNEDTSSDEDEAGGNEYEEEDADATHDGVFWMRSKSRRPSTQLPASKEEEEDAKDPVIELSPNVETSPMAGMTAFRDQLSAQIAQLQQTMHLNLPQIPQFNMGTLPDYQAYLQSAPMVRRISNLVGSNRPGSPSNKEQVQDHRWWDLFSNTVPSPPPAYEDIFPAGEVDANKDLDTKRSSAEQAAADALADQKCAAAFDQVETEAQAESSAIAEKRRTVKLDRVRIGQNCLVTREQQDQLRLAHAERVKRLRADQNLFFIWIPLLLIIILAMLYNRVPAFYNVVTDVVDLVRNRNMPRRFVEVQ